MTFVHQSAWGGIIAAYLFLGGLGGGIMALGAGADLYLQANDAGADRRPAIFAALTGLVALAVGSLLLVYDLLQPLAAIWGILSMNPGSWIGLGMIFITLYMGAGTLYVLPYLRKGSTRAPAPEWQRNMGLAAAILGVLVAIYTGFLLGSAVGIPFWNTPALPVLFVVSGLSTGAALLMLYLVWTRGASAYAHKLLHTLERVDVGLVVLELLILASFWNMTRFGNAAVRYSANYLFESTGFLLGVLGLGLLVPLGIEIAGMRAREGHGGAKSGLIALASLLVLAGGALLRFYILKAGVYAFPWQG